MISDIAKRKEKIIFTQVNTYTNISGGKLISISYNYAMDKPEVVFDKVLDRYTFVALTNTKGIRTILGTIYLRPSLIMDANSVSKQCSDIEGTLDKLLEYNGGN